MLTTNDLQVKLLRLYRELLYQWLKEENPFPIRLSLGRLPDTLAELRETDKNLSLWCKRYGYSIERVKRKSKTLGEQDFPVAVIVDTREGLLASVDKTEEFFLFQSDATLIRATLPLLEVWLLQYPERVIEYHGKWQELLEVCQFLIDNPQPDLFIRELPISPHTKFIEGHKRILRSLLDQLLNESIHEDQSNFASRYGLREDESLVRIRFLDHQLKQNFGLPLNDISIPISQLASINLQKDVALIVENKTTFLTLPALPKTFAIFGSGFDVNILKDTEWLKYTRILYWGDLDAQGFEILALLRRFLPQTESVMMDRETFEIFRASSVSGMPTVPTRYPQLTLEEWNMCQWLSDHNSRLEQERIQSQYAFERLQQVLSKRTID